jgi:uncharacterized protein YodC (DUF2158 family)
MPESSESFKAGDVVMLKSSGPVMTVMHTPRVTDDSVSCAYFKEDVLVIVELPQAVLFVPEVYK